MEWKPPYEIFVKADLGILLGDQVGHYESQGMIIPEKDLSKNGDKRTIQIRRFSSHDFRKANENVAYKT